MITKPSSSGEHAGAIAQDMWEMGLKDAQINNTPTVGLNNFNLVGCVPTESHKFNRFWRIVKRTTVEIGPGRSHEHVFNHKLDYLLDTETIATDGAEHGAICIKGLTTFTFLVVRGQVVDDSNTGGFGNIAYAPVKIVGMQRQKAIVTGKQIGRAHV